MTRTIRAGLTVVALGALALGTVPARADSVTRQYVGMAGYRTGTTGGQANQYLANCEAQNLYPSVGGVCIDHNLGSTTTFKVKVVDASGVKVPIWIAQRNAAETTLTRNFLCVGSTFVTVIRNLAAVRYRIYFVVGDQCANVAPGSWGPATSGTVTFSHP